MSPAPEAGLARDATSAKEFCKIALRLWAGAELTDGGPPD
jgi:hypothetical protein